MGKNILLITGSPRKGGNSSQMADAFTKGAVAAGHKVNRFDAAAHHIEGCIACDTCWSKGVPCSFSEEFNTAFAPLLEEADTLALCMPLYFYGFPAQIKAPLDKMYAYAVPQKKRGLKINESVFMICGGDSTELSFGGAAESYRQMAKYCGWKDRGMVIATSVMQKGDIAASGFLEKAEALGQSL